MVFSPVTSMSARQRYTDPRGFYIAIARPDKRAYAAAERYAYHSSIQSIEPVKIETDSVGLAGRMCFDGGCSDHCSHQHTDTHTDSRASHPACVCSPGDLELRYVTNADRPSVDLRLLTEKQ